MKKIDYLSTLFVGIDIGSRLNVISALNFEQEFLIRMASIPNSQYGAEQMELMIAEVLQQHHEFRSIIIGLESTGFYGVHIANYLSTCQMLAPFSTKVYCLNPTEVAKYKDPLSPLIRTMGLIPLSSLISPGSAGLTHSPGAGHSILHSSALHGTGFTLQNASPGRKPTCSTTSF